MRLVLALLAAIVVSLVSLVYGPPDLMAAPLPGGLPFGTLLALVALVAGAAIPLVVSRPGTALRWAGAGALAAALVWFPVGVALSGNVNLNFVNDAADSARFALVTRGVAATILASMAWAGVEGLLRRRGGASAAAA